MKAYWHPHLIKNRCQVRKLTFEKPALAFARVFSLNRLLRIFSIPGGRPGWNHHFLETLPCNIASRLLLLLFFVVPTPVFRFSLVAFRGTRFQVHKPPVFIFNLVCVFFAEPDFRYTNIFLLSPLALIFQLKAEPHFRYTNIFVLPPLLKSF